MNRKPEFYNIDDAWNEIEHYRGIFSDLALKISPRGFQRFNEHAKTFQNTKIDPTEIYWLQEAENFFVNPNQYKVNMESVLRRITFLKKNKPQANLDEMIKVKLLLESLKTELYGEVYPRSENTTLGYLRYGYKAPKEQ